MPRPCVLVERFRILDFAGETFEEARDLKVALADPDGDVSKEHDPDVAVVGDAVHEPTNRASR